MPHPCCDHKVHRPETLATSTVLMCACGKPNAECHPCRHRDQGDCPYIKDGCQHPIRCAAIAATAETAMRLNHVLTPPA